ncbi:MAG: A/G-specific adenine glycosylase [Bacilli bacterium]|nr:A/G-specific adenine glycosylase [Bacilli bacterium]
MYRKLLEWFSIHGRELPWRVSKDPYRVYLSEIMLQQTRVEAVKGYFERFLDHYPTVADLASSNEEDVLLLWKGLGYYSRARKLRQCAIEVMDRFGGEFPRTKEELLSLPGIGEYTASAISSICFLAKEAAVDGNLYRVYARLTATEKTLADKGEREACAEFYEAWMDKADPGDINQALMDLGELVCMPNGAPKCDECPFGDCCKAHAINKELLCPAKKVKKEKKSQPLIVFLLKSDGKYLLRKRSETGLLASLFEFPNAESVDLDSAKVSLGIKIENVRHVGKSKHVFTHLIWNMEWYEADVLGVPGPEYILASPEQVRAEYAIPSAFSYGLKAIN